MKAQMIEVRVFPKRRAPVNEAVVLRDVDYSTVTPMIENVVCVKSVGGLVPVSLDSDTTTGVIRSGALWQG